LGFGREILGFTEVAFPEVEGAFPEEEGAFLARDQKKACLQKDSVSGKLKKYLFLLSHKPILRYQLQHLWRPEPPVRSRKRQGLAEQIRLEPHSI